jgi:integrase
MEGVSELPEVAGAGGESCVVGLALRVTNGGAKAWVWEGRVKGRVRRITLGLHPALSLSVARDEALAMAAAVARGEDPAAARAREHGELTFGALAELYFERHARPRKRSADQDERMLRDVLGRPGKEPALIPATWKNRRLSDLTREDVAALHARVGRDSGHYMANRGLALVRAMFNLARTWGLVAGDNPAAGIPAFREEKRDRFLGPDELRRVLAAIEQEPDWRWRAYFRLAVLLGQRRQELLRAQWSELDFSARAWRLPMTKAGRPHLLPLPMPAIEILESLPSRGKSEWLFPSKKAGSGHLEEPKKAWQRIRQRAEANDVRIHDLRRTLGSWLAASGYGLPMIGRVLNHSQPSATAVYARLDVEPVRRALEANAQAMLAVELSTTAQTVKDTPDVAGKAGRQVDQRSMKKDRRKSAPTHRPV